MKHYEFRYGGVFYTEDEFIDALLSYIRNNSKQGLMKKTTEEEF